MSKFILTIHVDLMDERSNDEVLGLLAQFEDKLTAASIGRFVGSGGGMNQIDVSYLVEDEARAKNVMEVEFTSLGVAFKHSFNSEEFTGDEATLFDDVESVSLAKLSYFFGLILFLFISLLYVVWTLFTEIRK